MARIEYSQDLPAFDIVYHRQCSTNFRTFKQIPETYRDVREDDNPNPSKCGRPSDTYTEITFLQVTCYLEENDEEQMTINDLINKMNDYLNGTCFEPYSFLYMKKRLIDQFKDRIISTELDGKSNMMTFRSKSPKQQNIVSEK